MRSISTPHRKPASTVQQRAARSVAAPIAEEANSGSSAAASADDRRNGNGHAERPALGGLNDVVVSAARSGDHISIFHLLQHVFHAPAMAEFQASQDAPLYEPCDRLLARYRDQLLGHVQIVNRTLQFDSIALPISEIHHLGVLPELRRRGIGSQLLAAAEAKIVEEGGQLALLRTSDPQFFARRGWFVCGRHCFTTATARDVLAELTNQPPLATEASPLSQQRPLPTVRLWRQVEQDAVARLYNAHARQSRGAIERNHEYWRWLVSRHGYDRIYVAVDEAQTQDASREHSNIVGYAVVSDARILELVTSPDSPAAARQLLSRACSDAIERGESTIRLDAPADHPLHALMQSAGGRFVSSESEQGDVLMGKLFEPWQLLEQMRSDLHGRARAAGLTLPVEFGLCVDDTKRQIVISRRSTKLNQDKTGRSYLTSNPQQLCRLLLGEINVASAEAAGKIQASTRVAVELANVLFPQRPLWFSPLDHQPAE